MDAAGLDLILEAIDGLGSLTSFNAEFGRGIEALDDITENAQNFFEIGMWYENPQICDKVIKLHREALDGCYDKGDVIGFPEGREALRRSLEEQRGHLGEEQPSWKAQHATIQEILAADEARASSES